MRMLAENGVQIVGYVATKLATECTQRASPASTTNPTSSRRPAQMATGNLAVLVLSNGMMGSQLAEAVNDLKSSSKNCGTVRLG